MSKVINEDVRICNTCGEQTDINNCWTEDQEYWCTDDCVPKWKWVKMFGEEVSE